MSNTPMLTLGMDAGGTYTDLVLYDPNTKQVVKDLKIPTDHQNMLKTLDNGISQILQEISPNQVAMVNFATTFATNAIVEEQMRPVHLILIGYPPEQVAQAQAQGKLGTQSITVIPGGHLSNGNEKESLDETALVAAIQSLDGTIEGVALSSYFSTRNPSHELRAAQIIQSLRSDLVLSSGHTLTWSLDAYKRATTAALNAGLVPIILELLDALVEILAKHGVQAPLTVVRGDGTAVGEAWAKHHPVELILSGPAASAVGAGFLGAQAVGQRDMWICDIGGTTTDIIGLQENGRPQISQTGATVGTHSTLVKSIDIHTFGQGGDSQVSLAANGAITIGPNRMQPICSAAAVYPSMVKDLERLIQAEVRTDLIFVLPDTPKGQGSKVLEALNGNPMCLYDLMHLEQCNFVSKTYLEKLAKAGQIRLAGITPTDAFHVLGQFTRWNCQASTMAMEIMARGTNFTPVTLAKSILEQMEENISSAIFQKRIAPLVGFQGVTQDMAKLVAKALCKKEKLGDLMPLHLGSVLVGAGAPSSLITEQVAENLHCAPVLVEKAHVAGAVGAAVGTFSFTAVVHISQPIQDIYRVHHPLGIDDFSDLEEAVTHAKSVVEPWLQTQAQGAGVQQATVTMTRKDVTTGSDTYLWTDLEFTVE